MPVDVSVHKDGSTCTLHHDEEFLTIDVTSEVNTGPFPVSIYTRTECDFIGLGLERTLRNNIELARVILQSSLQYPDLLLLTIGHTANYLERTFK